MTYTLGVELGLPSLREVRSAGEIYLGLSAGHQRQVLRVLQLGHQKEAWALAHHPVMDGLCASGDSAGIIYFWDTEQRRPLPSKTYKSELAVGSLAFDELRKSICQSIRT